MYFKNIFLLTFIVSLSLFAFNPSKAEKKSVPILDKTTVQQTANNGVNKCIGANGSIIYTQFACPENSELIDKNWQENSNLTINHTRQSNLISLSQPSNKPSKDQAASPSPLPFNLEEILDPKGELNLKNISPAQILQQGIKAMMMRNSILDDI